MDLLLRSLIQIGGQPESSECINNWWIFEEFDFEFRDDDEKRIFFWLKSWYLQAVEGERGNPQGTPPTLEDAKRFFESTDTIEVGTRLEEIRASTNGKPSLIRTGFSQHCKHVKEQQEIKELSLLLRDTMAIAQYGRNLEKPINDKKIIRGLSDAIGFLTAKLNKFQANDKDDKTLDACVEEYDRLEALPRLRTGFSRLDDEMGGGFPTPRFVLMQGEPSAGKTSLCVYLAHKWLCEGHPTLFLAIDEDSIGIGARIKKLGMKFDMPALVREKGTIAAATAALLRMARVKHERNNQKRMSASLPLLEPKTPILVVDSLQTVHMHAESDLLKINANIDACKRAVMQGVFVMGISELNRGAYAAKKKEDRTRAIAGGKGSGRLEYGAQTALNLNQVDGHENKVEIEVTKNRGFKKNYSFILELNTLRMTYKEMSHQGGEDNLILKVLATHPNRSRDMLVEACRAAGWEGGWAKLQVILEALETDGRITRPKKEGWFWRLVQIDDLLFGSEPKPKPNNETH